MNYPLISLINIRFRQLNQNHKITNKSFWILHHLLVCFVTWMPFILCFLTDWLLTLFLSWATWTPPADNSCSCTQKQLLAFFDCFTTWYSAGPTKRFKLLCNEWAIIHIETWYSSGIFVTKSLKTVNDRLISSAAFPSSLDMA